MSSQKHRSDWTVVTAIEREFSGLAGSGMTLIPHARHTPPDCNAQKNYGVEMVMALRRLTNEHRHGGQN